MLISVVIPNFNDIRIDRTLKSIFSQSSNTFEVIIIDGGSNNLVLDIYKKYPINKLVVEKDNGIFDALNKGLKLAVGDIYFLIGSDDFLSDDHVFTDIIERFKFNPELDGVCIGCEHVDINLKTKRFWYPKKINSKNINKGILPPHFSLFLNKNLYDIVGNFDYRLTNNIATDSIWLLNLSKKVPNFKIEVDNKHCIYMQQGGFSNNSLSVKFKQFYFLFKYARDLKINNWFMFSIIKSTSKIFQYKLFNYGKTR